MAKCKHKRTIMATAYYVQFQPDSEPFQPEVVECAGVSSIIVPMIAMHYCPTCKVVVSLEDGGMEPTTTLCCCENRCDGHD